MTTIELSAAELRLLRNALHSFLTDFGHDEADVLHQVKELAGKLDAAASDGKHAAVNNA